MTIDFERTFSFGLVENTTCSLLVLIVYLDMLKYNANIIFILYLKRVQNNLQNKTYY